MLILCLLHLLVASYIGHDILLYFSEKVGNTYLLQVSNMSVFQVTFFQKMHKKVHVDSTKTTKTTHNLWSAALARMIICATWAQDSLLYSQL